MVEGITTYEYVVREQRKQREREEARAKTNKQVGPSLISGGLLHLSKSVGAPQPFHPLGFAILGCEMDSWRNADVW